MQTQFQTAALHRFDIKPQNALFVNLWTLNLRSSTERESNNEPLTGQYISVSTVIGPAMSYRFSNSLKQHQQITQIYV